MSENSETLFDRASTACRDAGDFLWRHRRKVMVGGVVCAAGLVAYSLYTSSRPKNEEEREAQPVRAASTPSVMKPANQPRMLRRLRKQYEIALRQFLPTLRIRILEVVDVSSAIKRIKELRSSSTENEDSARQIEEILWDDIKESSFTLLYVTAYMVSAICVLLRVQLHILGRSLHDSMERTHSASPRDIETGGSFASTSAGNHANNYNLDDDEPFGDDDTCRLLIEGTYKHLFGAGLQAFADLVKQAVSQSFAGWNVRDKLTVEYSELVYAMSQVRRYIEGDVPSIVRMIMLRKYTAQGILHHIDFKYLVYSSSTLFFNL
jgi:hypothetical protein